ncbi:MAG: BrnT family toxin [Gemmatimonadaceae bacterium]|nr:BrnT family toxin [Gemmatimonadaceae bacterium]
MNSEPQFDGFDWDDGNREKCRKHGISPEAIEELFGRVLAIAPDPFQNEPRFRAIGPANDGRMIFLVFTLRSRDNERLIRPISARFMHRREIRAYKEANPHILE